MPITSEISRITESEGISAEHNPTREKHPWGRCALSFDEGIDAITVRGGAYIDRNLVKRIVTEIGNAHGATTGDHFADQYFAFKEKIGWQAVLGTVLAIAGVAVLFLA